MLKEEHWGMRPDDDKEKEPIEPPTDPIGG